MKKCFWSITVFCSLIFMLSCTNNSNIASEEIYELNK